MLDVWTEFLRSGYHQKDEPVCAPRFAHLQLLPGNFHGIGKRHVLQHTYLMQVSPCKPIKVNFVEVSTWN